MGVRFSHPLLVEAPVPQIVEPVFFMRRGAQRKMSAEADGRPARRVVEEDIPLLDCAGGVGKYKNEKGMEKNYGITEAVAGCGL